MPNSVGSRCDLTVVFVFPECTFHSKQTKNYSTVRCSITKLSSAKTRDCLQLPFCSLRKPRSCFCFLPIVTLSLVAYNHMNGRLLRHSSCHVPVPSHVRGLTCTQAVIFSEGALTLDSCNFSGSTATELVFAEGANATTMMRNTVLGTSNC